MNRRLSIQLALTSILLWAVLVSACKPETRSQVLQPTNAPSAPPTSVAMTGASVAPAVAITSTLNTPSACQFSKIVSGNSIPPASLNDYIISPLTPILSDTSRMNIYDWIPDNKRLIISRFSPSTTNYTLSTLDVTTGLVQTYAERTNVDGERPIWIADLQAIAYTDFDLPQKPSSLPGIELWLSRGDPNETQRLAEHVSMNSLTVDDTGQLTYLFSQKNTEAVDLSVKTVNAASLSVQDIPLPAVLSRTSTSIDESLSEVEKPFRLLHRPTTSQALLLYKNQPPLLFDFDSEQICQLDLQSYVSEALWSPDDRFLAMRTQNMPIGFNATDGLTILDTSTNQYDEVDLGAHVYAMTWSPNGRYLAVLVRRQSESESGMHQNLYLVDAVTKEYRDILPEYDFRGGANQSNQMAWSFDGRTLAITCPVIPHDSPIITEYRLCMLQLSQVQ
jgi:dipeptidyl aminopeptidase/acylaminoacyl peptidase